MNLYADILYIMCTHWFLLFYVGCLGSQVLSIRQNRLSNKHLKVGALPAPPTFMITKDKNGQETYGGYMWDLMEYIKKARNCTVTVVVPQDKVWGHCHKKDNCTGMIGTVNSKDADFALGMTRKDVNLKIDFKVYIDEFFQDLSLLHQVIPKQLNSHGQFIWIITRLLFP